MDMMDQLLVFRANYEKKSYLNNFLEQLFYEPIKILFSFSL